MAWFDRGPGGKKDSEIEPESLTPPASSMTPESSPKTMEPAAPPAPPQSPKPMAAPAAASTAAAGLVAYLHKGSRISGQLTFQGPARIEGSVEGEIQCHGVLTVGESAEVRAKVSGQVVVISGKVEGNVTAKEKVELLSPARVIGNIHTPRLSITEGVLFDGDCSMGVGKQKGGVASPQALSADKASKVQAPTQHADSPK